MPGVPFDYARTLRDRLLPKLSQRARQIQAEALSLHQHAPRGGRVYTTYFYTDEHGRVRPVGHREPYQASAPGEPPASDTGRLLELIRNGTRPSQQLDPHQPFGFDVTVNYFYEEFGTRNMRPRPLGTIALEIVKADIAGANIGRPA